MTRHAHSAGVLAHVGAELERSEAQAFALAAEFMADSAGRAEPWPALFASWAAERGLSEDLAALVKVAILRTRCFGAMQRGAARARAYPEAARPHGRRRRG